VLRQIGVCSLTVIRFWRLQF